MSDLGDVIVLDSYKVYLSVIYLSQHLPGMTVPEAMKELIVLSIPLFTHVIVYLFIA